VSVASDTLTASSSAEISFISIGCMPCAPSSTEGGTSRGRPRISLHRPESASSRRCVPWQPPCRPIGAML
jgi:hypothetical protein